MEINHGTPWKTTGKPRSYVSLVQQTEFLRYTALTWFSFHSVRIGTLFKQGKNVYHWKPFFSCFRQSCIMPLEIVTSTQKNEYAGRRHFEYFHARVTTQIRQPAFEEQIVLQAIYYSVHNSPQILSDCSEQQLSVYPARIANNELLNYDTRNIRVPIEKKILIALF